MPWQTRNRSTDPDNKLPADNLLWVKEILSEFEGIQSSNKSTPEDRTLSKEEDLETLTKA